MGGRKRWLGAAAAALLLMLGAAIPGGREEGAAPPAALDAAREETRLNRDCQVIQTMGFSRCGHSVTRRISLPESLAGADFDAVQEYYALWRVEAFARDTVELSREIPLFCPAHQVLSVSEAGEIVRTKNVYGDGMAVLETYGRTVEDFEGEEKENLTLGLGFDSREEAEAWLAAH